MKRNIRAKKLLARTLGTALVVALFGGLSLSAQDEPEDGSQQVFFETVDVNVVTVDVYVTDNKGRPVSDLTREDFTVLEDGREMEITNFVRVEDRRPVTGPDAAPESERAETVPGPFVPGPEVSTPRDQGLYLVVFVDNLNIEPFNRNRVFTRLRGFLNDVLKPGDKVMLVTFDRSLEVRVPFTGDPVLVNSALFEIEEEAGQAVHRSSDRRDAIRGIENAESYHDALWRARSVAESLYNDIQMTIDSLRDLVSRIGGLDGRKAVVYVSDGLPMIPGEDLFYAINEKFKSSAVFSEARDFDTSRRFQELVAQANSSRVTFYTIDAAGLRTPTSASVETDFAGVSAFVDSQNIRNLQASLLEMADGTGGRAIINRNDVGPALEQVKEELETYYSIGYQAPHSGDGRYHRIEVQVEGKGLRVRHRRGYRDLSTTEKMESGTVASLRYGEDSNPFGVQLGFGEAVPRSEGHFLVPILVGIPLGQITLVPQNEIYASQLRLFLAAMDAEGGVSPVQSVPVPIEIPREDIDLAREKGWVFRTTLLMRAGSQRVTVGLRDYLAGEESYVTRRVEVP